MKMCWQQSLFKSNPKVRLILKVRESAFKTSTIPGAAWLLS